MATLASAIFFLLTIEKTANGHIKRFVLDYCEVANRTSLRTTTHLGRTLSTPAKSTITSLTMMKCIQLCASKDICGAITHVKNGERDDGVCKTFDGKYTIDDANDKVDANLVIIFKVPCQLNPAVNGNWSAWSNPSCSVQCGGGTRTRVRSCNNPTPAYGGDPCQGSGTRTEQCNTHNCPINGAWSAWSNPSCSVQCGGGTKTKRRSCNSPAPAYGGAPCPGSNSRAETCNTHTCPIHGQWGSWIPPNGEYRPCHPYGNCGGAHCLERRRHCNNPSPQNGGHYCAGNAWDNPPC